MGGSIHLPQFADLGALPAPHRGMGTLRGTGMSQAILHGPATHLSAVELEIVEAQGFGGGKAVRARRLASQAFFEEGNDRLGPSRGVVATRGARGPAVFLMACRRVQIVGPESIETATGEAQLLGGIGGG